MSIQVDNRNIMEYRMISLHIPRTMKLSLSVICIIGCSCILEVTGSSPYKENTRLVYFDIKFTMQGFENACWHREACRAIQHAFSKPSLVNFISKDPNLVFYLSIYPLLLAIMTYFVLFLCWFSVISDVIQKVQRHHNLIKVTCREIGNVY